MARQKLDFLKMAHLFLVFIFVFISVLFPRNSWIKCDLVESLNYRIFRVIFFVLTTFSNLSGY